MIKFLKWVFDTDTPEWVPLTVVVVGFFFSIGWLTLAVILTILGYWIAIPVMFIAIPLLVVLHEYS